MELKHIQWKKEEKGKILRLQLNRPEVRNSFNEVLIEDLHTIFSALNLREDSEWSNVRAVILEGTGSSFCGGGDLNWMKKSLELTKEENLKDCQKLSHMFFTMDRCPVPLIGKIHGHAIGGGVGLVSVCDHVIADEDTTFSLSEVKLGLIPACIGPFVIAKIGPSQARSLFISGERFKAEKAKSIGLVHEVCSADELEKKTLEVAKRILEGGPDAIEAAKFLIHTLTRDLQKEEFSKSLEFASAELAQLRVLPEAQEGLRAFLEKRSPSWRA